MAGGAWDGEGLWDGDWRWMVFDVESAGLHGWVRTRSRPTTRCGGCGWKTCSLEVTDDLSPRPP
jgi:hypothetical protein